MSEMVRILLVEDFAPDAELNKYQIEQLIPNSEFQVVETEKDFVEALENFKPHVIVSDYLMPQFSGLKALQLTLAKSDLIPFILCTGSMNEDVAVECMKQGALDYIIKEHKKRLGSSVKNALEHRKNLMIKKESEAKEIERKLDQQILLETSSSLLFGDNIRDVFQMVFEASCKLLPTCYIVLSKVDNEKKKGILVDWYGFDKYAGWITQLIKMKPFHFKTPLAKETIEEMIYNKGKLVKIEQGLYKFMAKTLPSSICTLIERTLEIKNIYHIGFTEGHSYTGGLTLLSRGPIATSKAEIIEIMVKQASQAMEKINALTESRQSQEKLRTVLEDSPLGLAEINERGYLLASNKAFKNLLGWSSSEEPASLHIFSAMKLSSYEEQRIKNNESIKVEKRLYFEELEQSFGAGLQASGFIDTELTIKAIEIIKDKKQQEYILQIQDITERKKIESAKNDFINTITHEMSTPLTAIQQAQLLLKKYTEQNLNPDLQQVLDTAIRNTDRLASLILNTLDYQKISSLSSPLNKKNININELIKQITDDLNYYSTNQKLSIQVKLEENLPQVIADREKIAQVLNNLISNAVKFTPMGEIVLLTQWVSDKKAVMVTCKDTGIGISKEHIEKITQPFYQVRDQDGIKAVGTGLGLSICNKILEGHQSGLIIESEPGKGSTFSFLLFKD